MEVNRITSRHSVHSSQPWDKCFDLSLGSSDPLLHFYTGGPKLNNCTTKPSVWSGGTLFLLIHSIHSKTNTDYKEKGYQKEKSNFWWWWDVLGRRHFSLWLKLNTLNQLSFLNPVDNFSIWEEIKDTGSYFTLLTNITDLWTVVLGLAVIEWNGLRLG